MSKSSVVDNENKIFYIEPNNLRDSLSQNAIPFPNEDYVMSVDLLVRMKSFNRYIAGNPEEPQMVTLFSTTLRPAESGKTRTYLTTDYTDISYTNPINNTAECFGLESLSITYESWMIPQVTAKFTDVRGASLMLPNETNYSRSIVGSGPLPLDGSAFFRALFTFPYPEFILKVKGFYGRIVEYRLTAEDVKSDFNATSGSFDVTVKFVGYLYRSLTDIPMSMIACAPYADSEYWEANGGKPINGTNAAIMGKFSFESDNGGTPMPPFGDFLCTVTNIAKMEEDAKANREESETIKSYNSLQAALNNLTNAYNTYIQESFGEMKSLPLSGCKQTIDNGSDIVLLFSSSSLQMPMLKIGDKTIFPKNGMTMEQAGEPLQGKWNKFKAEIEKYNKEVESDVANATFKVTEHVPTFGEIISVEGKKENWVDTINSKYGINIVANDIPEVGGGGKVAIISVLLGDYTKTFDALRGFFDKTVNGEKEKLEKKEPELQEKAIGWKNSIKNVYKLAFAHLDTFMHAFYKCLSNIYDDKDTGNRTLTALGISKQNTDLPPTFDESKPIPPFTQYYTIDKPDSSESTLGGTQYVKKSIGWIGDCEAAKTLPEVELVERLLKGAKEMRESYEAAVSELNEEMVTDEFIRITPYDFAFEGANPYRYISELSNKQLMWRYAYATFALRLYYFLITPYTNHNLEVFAKAEARNFCNAIQPYDKDTVGYVLSMSEEFIKSITQVSEESPFNLEAPFNQPLFTKNGDDKMVYSWEKDHNELLVGNCSFNDLKSKGKKINITNFTANTDSFVLKESSQSESLTEIWQRYNKDGRGYGTMKELGAGNTMEKAFNKKPSVIYTGSGKYCNIFGHCFYYMQNGDSSAHPRSVETKNMAKAYLYACGINNRYGDNSLVSFNGWAMPYWVVLKRGAMLWRNEQENDPIYCAWYKKAKKDECFFVKGTDTGAKPNYDFLKLLRIDSKEKYLPIYQARNEEEKNAYIKVFTDWAKNTFIPKIMKIYELTPENGCTYDYDSFKVYLQHIYDNGEDFQSEAYMSFKRVGKKIWRQFGQWFKKTINTDEGWIDLVLATTEEEDIKAEYEGWNFELVSEAKRVSHITDEEALLATQYRTFVKEWWAINLADVQKASDVLSVKDFGNTLKTFIEKLKGNEGYNLDDKTSDAPVQSPPMSSSEEDTITKDMKIATYMTLKNLYDKWVCAMPLKTWRIENDESIFKLFYFMNSFFKKNDDLAVNLKTIANIVSSVLPSSNVRSESNTDNTDASKQNGFSVYEFLSSVAQKADCLLIAFPTATYLRDVENIATELEDMFTPNVPWSARAKGPSACFLCIYPGKPSSHLAIEDENSEYFSQFKDDTFNIANAQGKIRRTSIDNLSNLMSNSDDDYAIPAFGVTYAKENQSFFTNISVGMQNPQQTNASIAAMFNIAAKGGDGETETIPYGQDLYSVYANYSYTCDVEMLGCMQMMPCMMFQLNNIPLFRGVYQIIKVEHNITPGNSTTKFTGVRMSAQQPHNVDTVPFAGGDYGYSLLVSNTNVAPITYASPSNNKCDEPKGCLYGYDTKEARLARVTENWKAHPGGGWDRSGYKDSKGWHGSDSDAMLQQLYTWVTVPARVGSPENYQMIKLEVNKNLASDFINIFTEIFGTGATDPNAVKVGGTYFYLTQANGGYHHGSALPTTRYDAAKNKSGTYRASLHNYGIAVDINANVNGQYFDEDAKKAHDKDANSATVIRAGHPVIKIFYKYGWHWGGAWSSQRDYMHFCAFNG